MRKRSQLNLPYTNALSVGFNRRSTINAAMGSSSSLLQPELSRNLSIQHPVVDLASINRTHGHVEPLKVAVILRQPNSRPKDKRWCLNSLTSKRAGGRKDLQGADNPLLTSHYEG
ncbi:hypothetical protein IWW38_003692, partial [Coemansia aciculifera]